MLINTVGSPASRSKRRHRLHPMAVLVLPVILGACVANQAGTASLAPATATTVAAQTDGGEAVAVAALAPSSRGQGVRENGTISGSAAIDGMIERAAAENGVPRELAFAVVRVESGYNPNAKGSGVYGLSQIMPATARSMGFSGPTEALFDPATNLRYGMRYLKGAWERGGGDVCQASMKYKGGHRATTMTRSAAAYCANVKRHMASITGRPVASDTMVASVRVEAPAAVAAIAPAARPSNAAARAIEASRTPVEAVAAAPAVEAPGIVVETPAVEAEAATPAADIAAVAETTTTSADPQTVESSEPDPARFGG